MRWVLWAGLLLAGCAAPMDEPPARAVSPARVNDPTLLAAFFGEGGMRAVAPAIRCAVRCQVVR